MPTTAVETLNRYRGHYPTNTFLGHVLIGLVSFCGKEIKRQVFQGKNASTRGRAWRFLLRSSFVPSDPAKWPLALGGDGRVRNGCEIHFLHERFSSACGVITLSVVQTNDVCFMFRSSDVLEWRSSFLNIQTENVNRESCLFDSYEGLVTCVTKSLIRAKYCIQTFNTGYLVFQSN